MVERRRRAAAPAFIKGLVRHNGEAFREAGSHFPSAIKTYNDLIHAVCSFEHLIAIRPCDPMRIPCQSTVSTGIVFSKRSLDPAVGDQPHQGYQDKYAAGDPCPEIGQRYCRRIEDRGCLPLEVVPDCFCQD